MIQYSPRWGSATVVCGAGVQGCADALLDHNEDQFGLIAGESRKAFDQLWDLVLLHHLQLAVRHTISIHHNLLRQVVVDLYRQTQRSYIR